MRLMFYDVGLTACGAAKVEKKLEKSVE